MPQKNLYSAGQLAEMGLPGLPKTKARIIDRATAEGWAFDLVTGVGGKRKMYEVPTKYLEGTSYAPSQAISQMAAIAGGGRADPETLATVIRTVDEFLSERGLVVSAERKSAIIATLYDYVARGAEKGDVQAFLKAVG